MYCTEWNTWEWKESGNQSAREINWHHPWQNGLWTPYIHVALVTYLGKYLNLWILASLSGRWIWFLLLEFFGWDDGWTKSIQRHKVESPTLVIPNHQERRARWVWMKEVCRLHKVYLRRASSDGLNQTVLPPHVVKMIQAHGEEHKLWSQPSRGKYWLLWTLTGFGFKFC